MKLLVDECVDRLVAQGLTDAGHDLLRLPVRLRATDDIHIAAYAIEVSRIVLTQDYDFGEIAVRHGWALPGVLLLACQSMPYRNAYGALSPRPAAPTMSIWAI